MSGNVSWDGRQWMQESTPVDVQDFLNYILLGMGGMFGYVTRTLSY